jgi:hypothetical protein
LSITVPPFFRKSLIAARKYAAPSSSQARNASGHD